MPQFFPWWVAVTHFLNLFFLLLLARSGLEVLSAFPKLYWYDDCPPGREWLRLSKKMYGADSRKPWSSPDEEEAWTPAIALPGKKNLGLGRHWHFMSVQFWILTGAVYIVLVFATGYWHYLIPTHWSIIPDAINSVGTYLHFQIPAKIPGEPFGPAQKLAYFVVVFLLAPFQVLTGAAMSPSVLARFPWYGKLFHGKQGVRSLHFLGLVVFGVSTVIHVFVTWFSLRYRRRTQHLLGVMVNPFERAISKSFNSRERYHRRDISPYFRVNGYPPTSADYERMAEGGGSRTTGCRSAASSTIRCHCPWRTCAGWASSPKSPSTIASRAGPPSRSGAACRWPAFSAADPVPVSASGQRTTETS